MEVIILAGGKGTRIKSVTKDKIPKPMLPVNGKPFLEYIFNWLKKEKVKKVILSIGFKGDVIKNYFKNKWENIEIAYSDEGKNLLGTGGAIKKASKLIKNDNFIVINGDTYFPIELKKLINLQNKKECDVGLALKLIENNNRYGTIKISEKNEILDFVEKGKNNNTSLINGGIYCLNKNVFKSISVEKFSFEKDVLENKTTTKYGLEFKDEFIDIGIPEDYERFKKLNNKGYIQ